HGSEKGITSGVLGAQQIEGADEQNGDQCPQSRAAPVPQCFPGDLALFVGDLDVVARGGLDDLGLLVLTQAEIMEGLDRAKRSGDGVIRKQQKGPDDAQEATAVLACGVYPTAGKHRSRLL